MPEATVAIEDRRFYEHGGIDVEGIARALWKNVNAGEVVEGGSTITQQLVRNLYISRERTVERKLKEACLAIKLNDAWSKSRILATYMNQVYYGNLAYGIEAARRRTTRRTRPS
jgi:membrane peptidoglycan carboxypeptidase